MISERETFTLKVSKYFFEFWSCKYYSKHIQNVWWSQGETFTLKVYDDGHNDDDDNVNYDDNDDIHDDDDDDDGEYYDADDDGDDGFHIL